MYLGTFMVQGCVLAESHGQDRVRQNLCPIVWDKHIFNQKNTEQLKIDFKLQSN